MYHRWKLLLAAALLLAVTPVLAGKTLSWDALDVRAVLDAGGRLHVTERHSMLFDGDWNGGERTFRVEEGQVLTVEELSRIDEAGVAHPMIEGDLSQVDHWEISGKKLRWRSRLPSDPAFRSTRLVYDIRYTLDRILLPGGGDRYTLNHDFGFPNPASAIGKYALTLSVAPDGVHPMRSVPRQRTNSHGRRFVSGCRRYGERPSVDPFPESRRLPPW